MDQETQTQFLVLLIVTEILGKATTLQLLLFSRTKWNNTCFAYFYHGSGEEKINIKL